MARELLEELKLSPPKGKREEYVWNPEDALEYFFVSMTNYNNIKGRV